MEKIIKIGSKSVPLKSTAASLIRYKSNFGRDGLKDLVTLSKGMSASKSNADDEKDSEKLLEDIMSNDSFDFDVFFRFLWVFAKSGDPSIPPMEEWLDEFDVEPIDFASSVLPQVVDLLSNSAKTTIKAKN